MVPYKVLNWYARPTVQSLAVNKFVRRCCFPPNTVVSDLLPKPSAALAQSVEHIIRNDGVVGSNPISGTSFHNKNNILHRNLNFPIGQNNYLL
jgi:hypothetical protein